MLEHLNPTPQKPSRVVVLGAYGFVADWPRAAFRCLRSTRTTST